MPEHSYAARLPFPAPPGSRAQLSYRYAHVGSRFSVNAAGPSLQSGCDHCACTADQPFSIEASSNDAISPLITRRVPRMAVGDASATAWAKL